MTEMQRHNHGPNQSRVETLEDGTARWDYRTAHDRAGDPTYTDFIPESCQRCWHQALAAEELGLPSPSAPDEEIRLDDAW